SRLTAYRATRRTGRDSAHPESPRSYNRLMEPLGPATVPLSMLVAFVSAKLMAELFERVGQPCIVGEILAGVSIGPSVLAWMVATSVGITAQVLATKGLLEERSSQVILAAAVIDDVLGLIVLALVSDMAKGPINYLDLGLTAALAVGFMAFIVFVGTRTARRV